MNTPHNYKAGGTVSVTLTDGTKIIDSPITETTAGSLTIANNSLVLVSAIVNNRTGVKIASVDSYTPPKPEWDRPDVRVVILNRTMIALRHTQLGVPMKDWWWIPGSNASGYTTKELADKGNGEWEVWAVAPEA